VSRSITERTARGRRVRRAVTTAVGMLSLLVLTSCSEAEVDQLKRLGLPEPASDKSPYMHDLWIGAWIAAGITGVLVWGLIIWTLIRYRRRDDDELPVQTRYNLPIEVLYTVAPVIVVAVLFFHTVKTQDKILEKNPDADHNVLVVGQQWSWTFSYEDEEALGGETDVYTYGTTAQEPTLYLPVDESVTFTLHSPDVIHSFWVPSFYFKLDIIPGRENSFSMTPTEVGEYAGRCAELCGLHHSRMLFTLKVVSREDFDQHIEELEAMGQVGTPRGGEHSDTPAGLDEENGGDQ
jgi:cytochrome c oxidase subunit 2